MSRGSLAVQVGLSRGGGGRAAVAANLGMTYLTHRQYRNLLRKVFHSDIFYPYDNNGVSTFDAGLEGGRGG
jgi:hypothetical protein